MQAWFLCRNQANCKSFLNWLILALWPSNLIQTSFITTISGLPTFSSDVNLGCYPQQQWWVGNASMIFVQKTGKWDIASQSIDSCSQTPNLIHFITIISGLTLSELISRGGVIPWWVGNACMTFVHKSDKWQIISQLIDSCSVAPNFDTDQLHNSNKWPTYF